MKNQPIHSIVLQEYLQKESTKLKIKEKIDAVVQ